MLVLELARLLRRGSAGLDCLLQARSHIWEGPAAELTTASAAHLPAQFLDTSAAKATSLFLLQVDQPLCAECSTRVREQIEARLAEVRADCAAYEAALARLASQDLQPLSEEVTDLVFSGVPGWQPSDKRLCDTAGPLQSLGNSVCQMRSGGHSKRDLHAALAYAPGAACQASAPCPNGSMLQLSPF